MSVSKASSARARERCTSAKYCAISVRIGAANLPRIGEKVGRQRGHAVVRRRQRILNPITLFIGAAAGRAVPRPTPAECGFPSSATRRRCVATSASSANECCWVIGPAFPATFGTVSYAVVSQKTRFALLLSQRQPSLVDITSPPASNYCAWLRSRVLPAFDLSCGWPACKQVGPGEMAVSTGLIRGRSLFKFAYLP